VPTGARAPARSQQRDSNAVRSPARQREPLLRKAPYGKSLKATISSPAPDGARAQSGHQSTEPHAPGRFLRKNLARHQPTPRLPSPSRPMKIPTGFRPKARGWPAVGLPRDPPRPKPQPRRGCVPVWPRSLPHVLLVPFQPMLSQEPPKLILERHLPIGVFT
jgi:hypothetical protein